ncbi:type II secretion system secretin GspD [Jannaschia sp. W003]|uniref:type II secretion system secretin GspD n=1 Tax=Jannaschia sp. W003 TaxID=2867012 RepID=UPI0021A5FBFA|nr:type II secretion system secretin GspD [Jannaschia sp. W003]UWQ23169.1 type II secretion system secretin GspD [Jannaschia sp. W003]
MPRPVAAALFALLLVVAPLAARAQITAVEGDGVVVATDGPLPDDQSFVINLRDTEIAALAEQVSEITGRTLIFDPDLTGEVTVVSSEPLDRDGVWALFQSVLRARGFAAVRIGAAWQVVPESEVRARSQSTGLIDAGSEDFVTELVRLDRLPAAEAVRLLTPLVAEAGYIEALSDPNAVLVTDTRSNVTRVLALAAELDGGAGTTAQVIRFSQGDAEQVGAAIAAVLGEEGGARISVDRGSNTIVVRGNLAQVAEIRRVASALDVAPPPPRRRATVRTEVFRLDFAVAESVAAVVAGAFAGGGGGLGAAEVVNPVAEAASEEGAVAAAAALPLAPDAVAVIPSTASNAVIVRGTAEQIQDAGRLIAALDQRRPQVLIEAAIVEVSAEVGERLGVQLGLGLGTTPGAFAATSLANSGTSLQAVLAALGETGAAALPTGLSIGASSGTFSVLVDALAQSSRANLLSTPSVTTMDNEAATIVVAQNVPFRTGSFLTEGATTTPFTTIERRDVGITMQVLPRVTAGGVVRLDIAQEVSSLANANVLGAADLITNRRVIDTTVLADNGGTVVLGGLISDDETEVEDKVPVLGDVPVVGGLFRSRQVQTTRRTLFVFLRPTILSTRHGSAGVAEDRLQSLRAAESLSTRAPRPTPRGAPVRKLPLEINGLY